MRALASTLAFAAALAAAAPASAQQFTPNAQIVQGLQGAVQDVPNVSAQALRGLAEAHMQYSGPPQDRPPLAIQLDQLAQINVEIEFDLNSAMVKPSSYRTLGAIADAMHNPELLGYKFLVVGNTDTTGTRAGNMKLSQERADAVATALTTTFRVDPRRIQAVGLGEENLQDAKNPTAAINRRVQIFNVGRAGALTPR
ncbi:OmpA family protein [Xanthobacter tagetidis]|jgi:outer membrane protein OmpA-like peptidoglycan-associated protein|uniref:OmpA family protein n=1 Tax=Xanthobacter tagetidis TaxID=60216 RepID=A0A3L7AE72_9HYPH|nr:OmpA family protein [Xanthobacter tagetidis]MBB6308540.1 outer membrane protein OmpA-like peptidoglycan-associated protein [Xanthobacter tagetidis]RLP78689.1 OmpA family protein [Xanthobacter tagetidis]